MIFKQILIESINYNIFEVCLIKILIKEREVNLTIKEMRETLKDSPKVDLFMAITDSDTIIASDLIKFVESH